MNPSVRWVLLVALIATSGEAEGAPGDSSVPPLATSADRTPVLARAAQLLQSAQAATEAARRSTLVEQGRGLLEAFIQEHPTHEEISRAEMLLGVFITIEGKGKAEAAVGQTDAERGDAETAEARRTLRDADRYFATATDRYAERLKGFPSFVSPESPEHSQKEAVKQEYLQARMYHAGVVEELAATYPADSNEAKELYRAAADRYETIYREYRILYAGLVARLKQGQCYRKLGETKRALGLYHDILSQPDDLTALRRLRITSMYLSLECWTTVQEKLYELAFSQGEEYLTHVRPEELRWAEWQAVRYHTARGYWLAAGALPVDRADERTEFEDHCRAHALKLAEAAGPYQAAARELLDKLDGPSRTAPNRPERPKAIVRRAVEVGRRAAPKFVESQR